MTPSPQGTIQERIIAAAARREPLRDQQRLTAYRLIHGAADGLPGIFVDKYGAGRTLIRHLGIAPTDPDAQKLANLVLEASRKLGISAIYDKPFSRDRSKIGGQEDPVLRDPAPIAGEPLPESIEVQEPSGRFEVRLYDGFSTGLFLDQRENRTHLRRWCAEHPGARVANLFAYTGSFSVACALGGAEVSTVDVSRRYLDWTKRNFALNDLDAACHHFARLDAREFLRIANRKGWRFDLVILDPPTFGSADAKRKIPAWSATRDYPELLSLARGALKPGGTIFASTNTAALCEPRALDRLIDDTLGLGVPSEPLPARQIDFPDGDAFPVSRLLAP